MTVPMGDGPALRRLYPADLTFQRASWLAMYMREEDRKECQLLGHTPMLALLAGVHAGGCVAIMDGWNANLEQPIGAFGWTRSGSIWGLFTDLTRAQQLEILRQTPQWVRGMVKESGWRTLGNIVHVANKSAIQWLIASECFEFDSGEPERIIIKGEAFMPFHTREDLLNV